MDSIRRFRFPIIAFFFVLGTGISFLVLLERYRIEEMHKAIDLLGIGQAYSLERQLDLSLSATIALSAFVRQDNERVIGNFDEFAANLLTSFSSVSTLQLAPNGIVTRIHPIAGNESAIGHDLLNDPGRRTEAIKAIESRQPTLAGPYALVQGGVAVIARKPVFISDDSGVEHFWGFTIALIGLTDLLEASGLHRYTDDGYSFELSRLHPDSGEPEVFGRSSKEDLLSPLHFEIDVPNGMWTLSIAPTEGWWSATFFFLEALPAILTAILAFYLTYALQSRVVERREGENRLAETLEYLDTVLMSLPVGVAILEGPEFRYYRVNKILADINGLPVESHMGRPLAEVLPEAAPDILPKLREVTKTGERTPQREFSTILPNIETPRWFMDSFHPIMGADKKPRAVVATVFEITERKQVDEALQRAHQGLEEQVRARTILLQSAHEQLRAEMDVNKRLETEARVSREALARVDRQESMGHLAGSIAHELNQPLTGILSNAQAAEILLSRSDYHDVGEILTDVIDDAKRAGTVLRNLRDLYRRQEAPPEALDLNMLVGDTLAMLSSEFVGRGVSVETRFTKSTRVVRANRVQIQQVLINLLNNAQQAMAGLPASDRLIVVRVEEGGVDGATVIVDDTGPGIEEDRLVKVFESLHTTRPEGMGMGLAICLSIVNAHGGKIWAENRDTGGARIVFELPFAGEDQ